MNTLPFGYEERVYAGVLGKIIGVYLGRPFEQWSNEKIESELGEIWYYVHERLNQPLVVSDDDISGTFTFLRALPDHGYSYNITAEQIGKTWLNYLIENRTILWWGGMGMSTEHTAYLRLKAGIPAPESGSAARNGVVVSEQIGAQIFIDGWAMVCPGDPEKAVGLACEAASVSHDGEAIYGAQVVAAMESLAFVESDTRKIIKDALTFIPRGSLIYKMVREIQDWHAATPNDWRSTLKKIQKKYGYEVYGGGCHMLPNHALIHLALLYGEDDFQKSLMIVNTAGYDTDCNSANVGCFLGIKNGLEGINKRVDFRGPVADRMYLPTADGGRCLTDAVRESYNIINIARTMQGLKPIYPNDGMRFHFDMPGSAQGFLPDECVEGRGAVSLGNEIVPRIDGAGVVQDERALVICYKGVGPGRVARTSTATFLPPEAMKPGGYSMMGCPTLYSGQIVRARIVADESLTKKATVRLFIRYYGDKDKQEILRSEPRTFEGGDSHLFQWQIPDTDGAPIAEVGVEVGGESGSGKLYMDWIHWSGAPRVSLKRPEKRGQAWRRAWVNAADHFEEWGHTPEMHYKVIQDEGTGLIYQGEAPTWSDYTVSTTGYAHLADRFGIVACVRGLRQYVALTLAPDGMARLIEQRDEVALVLDEAPLGWEHDKLYLFSLTTKRDGTLTAEVRRSDETFEPVVLKGSIRLDAANGAVGMLVTVGHAQFGAFQVEPNG